MAEEERRTKHERLRAVRGGHRGVTTKLIKEADELLAVSPLTVEGRSRLDVINKQLRLKAELLRGLDTEIVSLCDVSDIQGEIEEAEGITAKIIEYRTKIDKAIIPETENVRCMPPDSTVAHANPAYTKTRLPKLTLPKFKGDVTMWTTFWDSYKCSVHESKDIATVDKFNYLKSLLEGPAARCIQGLSITESNYMGAVELLQQRFGKPQQVISAHMDELLKLPGCSNDKPSSLRYVLDKVNVHIRGLASLGVASEQYGSLLIPIIMSKLPGDLRLRIAREAGHEVWKIDDLIEVIRVEVEAREASEGIKANFLRPQGQPPSRNPSSSANPTPSTGSALVSNNCKVRCAYCGEDHFSASCSKVTDIPDRKRILLKAGRCFNCLRQNHKCRDCPSHKSCRYCHKKHHQSICEQSASRGSTSPLTEQSQEENTTSANTTNTVKDRRTILLQTARAVAFGDASKQPVPVRILFDNGSQMSYITESLQRKLNLKPIKVEKLHLNTFGTVGYKTQSCSIVKLFLQKPGCKETVTISALSSPVICSPLPSAIDSQRYTHLNGLTLADSGNNSQETIDILIGSNFYWNIVTGEIRRGEDGPVAVSSKFGWLLSGPMQSLASLQVSHSNVVITGGFTNPLQYNEDTELIAALKGFWEMESMGISEEPTVAGKLSDASLFLPSIQFKDGRYEVALPWKETPPRIPSHLALCENRLRSLQRRFKFDPELFQEYNKIIREQLRLGILETVTDTNPSIADKRVIHYLPHHGVVRRESQTTKLRIVYDGSARDVGDEYSLNDCLQKGPNFIPQLFDILIQFRWNNIAVTADIEKAFLMVGVNEVDRDVLRFLWFKHPNETSEMIHLRFTRLVFGLRPSPAVLGAVISHHLEKHREQNPELVRKIESSLYVDDLVSGADNVQDAFRFYTDSKSLMSCAGMNLRKWNSNSVELLTLIKRANSQSLQTVEDAVQVTEEDESYAKATTGYSPNIEEDNLVKLLGVLWNSSQDYLTFNFTELIKYANSLSATKRSLLKLTAKIFDPLGFLSPFVIQLKIFFQNLCSERCSWDDPLSEEAYDKWKRVVSEFRYLNDIRIPRCYFHLGQNVITSQLHGFCDASDSAFAAVAYIRSLYSDGSTDVRLIASKTRVAPLKKQSIPRLELLGAVILARLVTTILKSMPTSLPLPVFYWTDSMTALHWICNHKQWKQYVNHRVAEIRRLSVHGQWRHCPGSLNPADLPSRGVNGEKLSSNSLWWNGPSFLQLTENKWPMLEAPPTNKNAEAELVKNPVLSTHAMLVADTATPIVNLEEIIQCTRFSTFGRLLRVTAYVLKFIKRLRQPVSMPKNSDYVCHTVLPSAEELNFAETYWIRSIQAKSFASEICYLLSDRQSSKPIRVDQFGLFLDSDKMLKCRGRINLANLPAISKRPILMPSKHPLVELLIRDVHERIKHSGTSDTLSTLREKFWILKGRQAVKRVLKSCTTCNRFEGLPYASVISPDLPAIRVSDDPPFTHTGVDYVGPLYTYGNSPNKVETAKAYICLFTCASTRAVHLELASDMSEQSFLLMFRRFVSRRGLPATLLSDNAKTFQSSSKKILNIARAADVIKYLNNNRITWRFIMERAPWWGGFWERLIRSVKRCLKKCVGRANLTFEQLRTVIVEIEAVVNARPLTYVCDDQDGVSQALSPSHLIYGRKISVVPNNEIFEIVSTHQSLTRRAKHQRHILTQFTHQWRRDYLLNLRENCMCRIKGNRSPIKKGDVVILKDDNTKRLFWKLAVVQELLPGRDGQVRAAIVKVGATDEGKRETLLKRSIQHLYPIEVQSNQSQ